MIFFDSKPPLSLEEFVRDCERLLSPQETVLIKQLIEDAIVTDGIKTANSVFREEVEFTHQLCNQLAKLRAERAGKDPLKYVRGEVVNDPFFAEVIRQADIAKNPLVAERLLDKTRWDFLDRLQTGHFFDLEFILIYALKLKILNRYAMIESPKGREVFDEFKKIGAPEEVSFPHGVGGNPN